MLNKVGKPLLIFFTVILGLAFPAAGVMSILSLMVFVEGATPLDIIGGIYLLTGPLQIIAAIYAGWYLYKKQDSRYLLAISLPIIIFIAFYYLLSFVAMFL